MYNQTHAMGAIISFSNIFELTIAGLLRFVQMCISYLTFVHAIPFRLPRIYATLSAAAKSS